MKASLSTLLAVLGLCLGTDSFAQGVGPSSFNISGGLFEPSGAVVTNSSVDFQLEILDKNELCVLYVEEHQNINLSGSKGRFSLELGRGTNSSNRLSGGGAFTNALFKNSGATGAFAGCAAGVTLNSGDERVVRVSYDIGAGLQAMTPSVPIQSAAYSMVAETLGGKAASEFLQVRDDATYDLNQTNLESIFSAVNFAKLTQILSGNWGNTTLTNVGTPSAGTDATNKNYVDANIGGKIADVTTVGPATGNGHTLIWDQALNRWVTGTPSATDATKLPLAGGTMTGAIAMGAQNITNIGHMTMATQRTLNLGTYDSAQEGVLVGTLGVGDKGKIWFNSQANVFKVWNGTAAVSTFGASGTAGGDLTGTYPNPDIATGVVGSTELTDGGIATIDIANDAVSAAKINNTGIAVNRLLITDATTGATVTYKTCGLDEGLKWTATGWACSTAAAFIGTTGVTAATYGNATQVSQVQVDAQGRVVTAANVSIAFPVVSVAGKTGAVTLNTADISGLGTAALKAYGTAAGNLVELDAGAKIPASLLPSTSGDIQDVIAGSGLTGGGTSGSVTLAVDTGVTNGKIVAVGASDKLPAIDGSNLTAINAVQLQTRNVAATAPTAAQVLTWNAGLSAWEPQALPAGNAGDITSVSASTGLTGGSASGDATLAVDVGTVTGKIVQMAASNKLPAVDGSNLTSINAVQLQTRNVSATAPTASQVLRWNAGTSVWEPGTETDAFSGTVTSVVSGTGLLGGNIISTGTLAVDVGTTTGKIVQMAASDKLPAVDGSNLTAINAVQLQTRNVAATAPTSGQYMVWNSGTSAWEPQTLPAGNSGDITSVSASTGLTGGSASGDATLAVDVGTVTGKIVQMAASNKLPAVDGSNLTQINAVQLQARNVASTAPTASQVLRWNAGTSVWEPGTQTDSFVGTVTSVVGGAGLLGGNITATGTLAIDVGVTTGKIVQMAASDKLPAVDGSNLTQINAVQLQTRNVSSAAPTDSQVLTWNNGASVWEARALPAGNSGDITSVSASTGLTGGSASGDATLAVDVGTVTGKIVQMAASNKLPAVDGSNLTSVNATKLQTRNVSSTAPTANQVLAWNAGNSTWEPKTESTGGASQWTTSGAHIYYGNGANTAKATIGSSASFGKLTLSYDDGSGGSAPMTLAATNNYLSLGGQEYGAGNGSYRVMGFGQQGSYSPAYVGYQEMESANATYGDLIFGTRSTDSDVVASERLRITGAGNVGIGTASPNQKLTVEGPMSLRAQAAPSLTANYGKVYVDSGDANKLKYMNPAGSIVDLTAGAAAVTSVVSGSGLLGGNITTTGTLAVDVGTTTGKIVQMAASNKLPAVDGSNLTAINAVQLQTRNVSATAPTANQVLAWNAGNTTWEPKDAGGGASTFANGGNSFGAAATLGTNDNFALNFEANNATAMTILPSGNVGIGYATPGAALQVGDPSTGVPAPRQFYAAEFDSSGLGRPAFVGNWGASGGWGIGQDGLGSGAMIRIGSVGGPGSDWDATQDLSLVVGSKIGIGTTATPSNTLHAKVSDAATNVTTNLLRLEHESTGTPAASFGTGVLFTGESSTTSNQDMAQISSIWTTATHASRASALTFSTVTGAGALTERVRIDGAGNMGIGTSGPLTSKLEVNGRIVSTLTSDADALSALTVDFSNSNVIDATGASGACGTLNITNTASGGSFTLTIANATSTCTTIQWNGSGTGIKLPAGYAGGVASAGLVYSFIHSGSTLWVTNVTY